MKRTFTCVALYSILIVTAGAASGLSTPPVRILPVGDSITLGAGTSGGYRVGLYRLLTNAGYNLDFVGTQTDSSNPLLPDADHEGHGGWRIDQIASIITTVFAQVEDPDVILLLLGTNDYGQEHEFGTAIVRLEALIAKMAIDRPSAKIIVANLLVRGEPQNSQIQGTFNAFVPAVVQQQAALGRQVYFTDMRSALTLADLLPDALHPNAEGYAKMATNWFAAITNVIGPLGTTNAPELVRALSLPGRTNVIVTFSKPLSDDAAQPAHYSLDQGASVLGASLDDASKRVITLVTTAQRPGADYTLSVNGVRDRTTAQRFIASNSNIHFIAAPVRGVLTNAPESAAYEQVYTLNIPTTANWQINPVPYSTNRHSEVGAFSRVAYYLELQKAGGPLQFLWASMDAFTDDAGKVGVPTLSSGAFFQQPVNNLTVRSSVPGVINGTRMAGGFLEFWPYNYEQDNAYGVPNASSMTYDWGDNPTLAGMYGSMQLHNTSAGQVLFAFNRWGNGSANIDLGIGNNTANADADWTFIGNSASYTVRELQVFVRPALGPTLGVRLDSAGQVELSWAETGSVGFAPETIDSFPSGVWAPINATVVVTNGLRTVSISPTNGSRFFRLRNPL